MKNIMAAFTLMTCICLGADSVPTTDTTADDSSDSKVTERPAKQVREHSKHIQEEASRARERGASALAEAGDQAEVVEWQSNLDNGFGFAMNSSGRRIAQPLVVRTKAPETGTASTLSEDLAVMSRILSKAIGREGRDSAMGIVLSALPGSRVPQSMYLEGYGALFLIDVKFPLLPAPAKPDEKAETSVDTTWEQTKRELYGQKTTSVRVFNFSSGEAVEYDADKVEELKKGLLDALKNCSNIRDLKPDEFVTIVVTGNRAADGPTRVKRTARPNRKTETRILGEGPGLDRETVMTLRVKKADAEPFAQGTIDREQFAKRVSILAY